MDSARHQERDTMTTESNQEAALRAAHDRFFTALNAMFANDLAPMMPSGRTTVT